MIKKYKQPNFINVYLNIIHIEEYFNRLVSAKNLKEFRQIAIQLQKSSDCVPVKIQCNVNADGKYIDIIIKTSYYKFDSMNTIIGLNYSCSFSEKQGFSEGNRKYVFIVDNKPHNIDDGFRAVIGKNSM